MYHHRFSAADLSEFLAAMGEMSDSDPCQAERLAFAIRKQCPTVADIIAKLATTKAAPNPFPALETITAAQCTVFDNWKPYGGRKPSRKKGEGGARSERFKATVEVWTIKPSGEIEARRGKAKKRKAFTLTSHNAAFVGTAHLLDAPNLTAKVHELRQPTKTLRPFRARGEHDEEGRRLEAYGDTLIGMTETMIEQGLRAGPLFTLKGGTYFHADTFAVTSEECLTGHSTDLKLMVVTSMGAFTFADFATTYPDGLPLTGNAIVTSRLTNLDQKAAWATGQLPA